MWVVGNSGLALHWDGVEWDGADLPRDPDGGFIGSPRAIWGSGPSNVWTVGESGSVLHFDGATWTPEPTDTKLDLLDVVGFGDSLIAVGRGGTVLRRTR